MKLVSYLNFGGNCAAAFKYYERVLGGKIEMLMTHADMPPRHKHRRRPIGRT